MKRKGRLHAGLLCAVFTAGLLAIAITGQARTDWTGQGLILEARALPSVIHNATLRYQDDDVPPAPTGFGPDVDGDDVRPARYNNPPPLPERDPTCAGAAVEPTCAGAAVAPQCVYVQRQAVQCVQFVRPAAVGCAGIGRQRLGILGRLRERRATRAVIGCAGVGAVIVAPAAVGCAR